ncbi:butyrophilin-like protein 2 [Chanodichthys erythropterus]|uniref:butyrophilin-like protein 2 n=1 Tax=Chanodichthys erythropterus TaxID=933992 RepID=UPI00351EAFA7
MDLFMIVLAVIPVVSDGFTVHSTSGPLVAPLGSSVVLPCYVDELLLMEGLKVEWRRTDSEALVHLFLDSKSRAEAQQQDYYDRAHFFTDQIQHGNFSLRLNNLRAEDEGKYTCEVYSQEDSGETVVQIKNVERLIVSGPDESISASVGEDVTLNCSVDSHITPEHFEEVSWKKTDEDEDILVLLYQNNEALPDSSDEQYRDRAEFFTDEIPKGNFSLRLRSVRTEDKGVYICQVFAGGLSASATVVLERLGFSVSHIIVLILCISASVSALLLCALIYYRSPNKGVIVKGPSNSLFVPLGGSVVLPCYADRKLGQFKEKLEIKWKRNNSQLVNLYEDYDNQPEDQQQKYHDRAHFFTDEIQHGNFSLRLDNLRADDEGLYTCEVFRNSDLLISDSTKLELKFTEGRFFHPYFALGSSVVLPCYVDKPLPVEGLKLEWRRIGSDTLVHLYQDGESRPAQQGYHDRAHFFTDEIQHGNYSLRVDNLRAEDEGKYECFTVQRSDSLVVPLGGSVVLPCYVDPLLRTSSLKVEWKKMHTLVHLYQDGE